MATTKDHDTRRIQIYLCMGIRASDDGSLSWNSFRSPFNLLFCQRNGAQVFVSQTRSLIRSRRHSSEYSISGQLILVGVILPTTFPSHFLAHLSNSESNLNDCCNIGTDRLVDGKIWSQS
jgi:hypothetical protein